MRRACVRVRVGGWCVCVCDIVYYIIEVVLLNRVCTYRLEYGCGGGRGGASALLRYLRDAITKNG